ncbi:hypothetical protein D3C81_1123960 [compost metagenome]
MAYDAFFDIILLIDDQSHGEQGTAAVDPKPFPEWAHKPGYVKIRQQVEPTSAKLPALHVQP